MQILTKTTQWFKSQVATPGDDFKQTGDAQRSPKKTALVSTAVGAGVGAAVGGGVAYHSMANDSVYFDWVTETMPLAASGPTPEEVFGGDVNQFQSLVANQSQSGVSSKETLQYLSYLKYQSPKMSGDELMGIYQSLEGQLGEDNQVRDALNMISAHVDRHGTTPTEAHQEFTHYFGYQSDFGKASQLFLEDQKLTDQELNATSVQMVQKHTSPIGHLGMAKAVGLGVAAGIAAGAATGLVVGVGINVFQKLLGDR
jgi:hypothetical protein